ncbi:serine proteinase stubble [Plutella xylostella]|uniref:serine proteinase stubble n=1 Tax=Plutella xylostella TaxID=51655 RepID=UPI002032CA20|nr:serine proteinase stubble [Plutella xylostella]
MGPPITWPHSHPRLTIEQEREKEKYIAQNHKDISEIFHRRSFLENILFNCRGVYLNLTVALILVQVLLNLSVVVAGPVLLSPEYNRGPVTLARNIRHLPCISRRTGAEGVCMFAIDCLKANGSHLGTCIDRFYFGSCCQIQDKTILPQIIGNNIEDNTIDSSNFVHPHTEDKVNVNKIPEVFPIRKTTVEDVVRTTTEKVETASFKTETTVEMESKTDTLTTLDNKIASDEMKTTAVVNDLPDDEAVKATSKLPSSISTEIPIKLSTFQTVSGESNNLITDKPVSKEPEEISTEAPKITTTSAVSSETESVSTSTAKPTTTKKPARPTYKPRPPYRPSNTTRPQFSTTRPGNATVRPKPPSVFNTTRKPPYRPPPKRPTSTKKPLPSPPRLNITILPQLTSSRPIFTRPSATTTITYINTSTSTTEETTTVTSTTTPSTTTTSTTTTPEPTTTSEKAATEPSSAETLASEAPLTEKIEPMPTTIQEQPMTTLEEVKLTTVASTSTEAVTVKETLKPSTEADAPAVKPEVVSSSSTEFPPGLVTWSNMVDTVTKAPQASPEANATESDEIWSPITPPEGWILISTIPPRREPSSTTTTEPPPTTPSSSPMPSSSSSEPVVEQTSTSTTEETLPEETIVPSPEPTTVILSSSSPTTLSSSSSTSTTESITNEITGSTEESNETNSSTEDFLTNDTVPPTEENTDKTTFITSQGTTDQAETVTESQMTETVTMQEFTINVTINPTTVAPVTAVSLTDNVTEVSAGNVSEVTTEAGKVNATMEAASEGSNVTSPAPPTLNATTVSPTEGLNMSDYKDVCGRRLWPEARIVGGAKSGFGRWPWQISLRQWRTSTYLHKCGAALLNENWAITAAHCVEHVPPSELLVRLGEHDLANESEPYGFAERRVQIVASHPHFDPATFEYDLALLRFYEPVNFQPNILPVCVPDTDEDYVGKVAYVTGWGRLYDEGPLPSVLQEVEVPVINNTACEAMYQAAGYNEHIPNIFICAGLRRGGADSCEGDSGGPMVVQRDRDRRFVLGGVISWGIGCAEPNQPGVYTRISEFRDWINQILQF